MVFLVSVGTDLYGRKANAKLEFPSCPTMAELINAVESHYDVETRSQRPAGYPDIPFRAETMQVYDDVLLRWVDLYSPSQLADGCQAFCFQPESIWHSDAQDIIPEGKQAVTWTTPMGSPSRARAARDAGIPPALSEKLRSVFYDIDTGNKGYVLYTDLRAAFQRCDIEFTYSTVGELFTAADADRSGHITYDEWVRFAINFPQVVDALFFRLRDLYQDHSAFQRRAAHAAAAEEARAAPPARGCRAGRRRAGGRRPGAARGGAPPPVRGAVGLRRARPPAGRLRRGPPRGAGRHAPRGVRAGAARGGSRPHAEGARGGARAGSVGQAALLPLEPRPLQVRAPAPRATAARLACV
eukprot:TRINITY_DN3129_c1_g3_i2.p1 TRINITY_DN3129_c1_g3~~TRINITY_DN3129_c1_g3_i2.p1  ORF type:complete len:383 (+),score=65.06 TRINITY_DN3129_c1_g3_i2:87-1151(+)